MTPRRHQRRPLGSPVVPCRRFGGDQPVWLAASPLPSSWAGPGLRHAGGPVPSGIVAAAFATAFWWLTPWILLAGRISWLRLLPPARATGVFYVGMVWQERGPSFAAAFRKVQQAS
jgi:hypothetical protein